MKGKILIMKINYILKHLIEKVVHRKLILLPEHSDPLIIDRREGEGLIHLRYNYRALPQSYITYEMQVSGTELTYRLFTMAFSTNNREKLNQQCLYFNIPIIKQGDTLKVSLIEPLAWHNDTPIKLVLYDHEPARKFTAQLGLSNEHGRLTRLCSHYLPYENKTIGEDYYFGDDYISYPDQTNIKLALGLVKNYLKSGILLDIGCALGIYTKAFLDAGFDAYGVDISEFAIDYAKNLVGTNRVHTCNFDKEEIPFNLTFNILWMSDVLEHASDPLGLLNKVSKIASPGAYLFLNTSNSESLTHYIMGRDWEGYSDYSHYGANNVSATSLRGWLVSLGWEILKWECNKIWIVGNDPTFHRLQEVFNKIPDLATLLSERDLGDNIFVIARAP